MQIKTRTVQTVGGEGGQHVQVSKREDYDLSGDNMGEKHDLNVDSMGEQSDVKKSMVCVKLMPSQK